jgi:hypothetical protein
MWVWTEAACVDRPLDLAGRGFQQQLRIRAVPGGLMLLADSVLGTEACSRTVVRIARPDPEEPGLWRFEEQASVPLPPSGNCGTTARSAQRGVIRPCGDRLELLLYRSAWCGGFDARFAYRRAAVLPLSERQVIRHYAAHFNRRDAEALAALFAADGSLVEPFTPTDQGTPRRHDGRTAVQQWYAGVFASVPWLALRLVSTAGSPGAGHHVAEWQYMDPQLAGPFSGRNTFIIAGGEIFETEVQLTSEIVPAPAAEPL